MPQHDNDYEPFFAWKYSPAVIVNQNDDALRLEPICCTWLRESHTETSRNVLQFQIGHVFHI